MLNASFQSVCWIATPPALIGRSRRRLKCDRRDIPRYFRDKMDPQIAAILASRRARLDLSRDTDQFIVSSSLGGAGHHTQHLALQMKVAVVWGCSEMVQHGYAPEAGRETVLDYSLGPGLGAASIAKYTVRRYVVCLGPDGEVAHA